MPDLPFAELDAHNSAALEIPEFTIRSWLFRRQWDFARMLAAWTVQRSSSYVALRARGTYHAFVLNLCSIRPKPRCDTYVLGLSRIRTMAARGRPRTAAWREKAGPSRYYPIAEVGNYPKRRVTVAG